MSTDPRRFLYRSDALQPEAALRLTADALKNCDDGELYLQYTASVLGGGASAAMHRKQAEPGTAEEEKSDS